MVKNAHILSVKKYINRENAPAETGEERGNYELEHLLTEKVNIKRTELSKEYNSQEG